MLGTIFLLISTFKLHEFLRWQEVFTCEMLMPLECVYSVHLRANSNLILFLFEALKPLL